MITAAVIASGQSLKLREVQYLRGKVDHIIAISNVALDYAPWADALVSHDTNWYYAHPEYRGFTGRRFCSKPFPYTEIYKPPAAINSGLMGMFVARDVYKATRIILLGFDMHGTHYFGRHKKKGAKPLINTTPSIFMAHLKQFSLFSGCEVINCTPDSALTIYPMMALADAVR